MRRLLYDGRSRERALKPRELHGGCYRPMVETPCPVFYRREETVYVLYLMRGERKLRRHALAARTRKAVLQIRERTESFLQDDNQSFERSLVI